MRAGACAVSVAIAIAWSADARAHALDVSTSKLTLRDGHVEVLAEWDLLLLADAAPTAIATASEGDLDRTRAAMLRTIETQTRLSVDGADVPLSLTAFPPPAELRAMAAQVSAAGQDHGALVRLRLEARQPAAGARELSLSSPAKLGPVLTTFVQPSMRYAQPGQAAAFSVLLPPSAPVTPAPPEKPPADASVAPRAPAWPVLAGLASSLALAALALLLTRRRSPA